MFEGLSDWDLIDVMGEATRDESTAIAQRLAAVAELFVRRADAGTEKDWWVVDNCAAVAAEIAPVQRISQARAVSQVQFACALRQRLPAVAKRFSSGCIDFRVVAMIINRTDNVDLDLMPALDEAIAAHAHKWMRFSLPKLRDRIDMWVAKFDAAAVRVPPEVDNGRYVDIESTRPGMAGMAASLHAGDGAALDQRLDALAATVCANDPRTKQQRRADACGALARGEQVLACQCGADQCPADAERDTTAAAVIHVLAEQATLDGASTPGYLPGYGILPAQCVRDLAATARLKPVLIPAGVAPDPGYRPSAVTAAFVRWRDLTCRWPGCDLPAQACDFDHTVPYPLVPTHPSGGKLYCRIHHLLKTFYCGRGGWSEHQLSEGTLLLTAPTGHLYTTRAHGSVLFPALAQSTGTLTIPTHVIADHPDRSAMMPRRKQTRAQDRARRIEAERARRRELCEIPENDGENPYFPAKPPPPDDNDPPPF